MYNMQRNYTLQNVKKKNIVNFCIHKYLYTMSFFPHITTTTNQRRHLKEIESKVSLPVAYRTRQCDTITVPQATTFAWRLGVKNAPEKPRWIVIGFQTGKSGDQTQNPAIFDHVNLKNIYVMLNSTRYPAVDYNLSFANQ